MSKKYNQTYTFQVIYKIDDEVKKSDYIAKSFSEVIENLDIPDKSLISIKRRGLKK